MPTCMHTHKQTPPTHTNEHISKHSVLETHSNSA